MKVTISQAFELTATIEIPDNLSNDDARDAASEAADKVIATKTLKDADWGSAIFYKGGPPCDGGEEWFDL